jgi:polysaccharide deacetylase 2 family uncharacterized protein YibQ
MARKRSSRKSSAMKRFGAAFGVRWRALSRSLRRGVAVAIVLAIGLIIVVVAIGQAPVRDPARRVAAAPVVHPVAPLEAPRAVEARPEPQTEVARQEALLPPRLPSPVIAPAQPAWRRFAAAPPAIEGRAMVAIVLDDLGLDRKRTERAIHLPGPLTLSFMTYAYELPRQTAMAHEAGHELLVHVPMQPLDAHLDSGPNSLQADLGRDEVLRRLRWGLDRFSGYVGINNHMGSRFTSDAIAMAPVIEELHARGLLFLDSRTTATTVGEALARKRGVPAIARNVFLDDEVASPAIAARLADVEQAARRKGAAVAIGHAHDATLAALAAWLPALAAKHLVLVPLSTVVRHNESGADATLSRRDSPG